jgi:hypothetical protein
MNASSHQALYRQACSGLPTAAWDQQARQAQSNSSNVAPVGYSRHSSTDLERGASTRPRFDGRYNKERGAQGPPTRSAALANSEPGRAVFHRRHTRTRQEVWRDTTVKPACNHRHRTLCARVVEQLQQGSPTNSPSWRRHGDPAAVMRPSSAQLCERPARPATDDFRNSNWSDP